jgi:hypothetical protein
MRPSSPTLLGAAAARATLMQPNVLMASARASERRAAGQIAAWCASRRDG